MTVKTDTNIEDQMYESIDEDPHAFNDPTTARLTVHENQVINSNTVDGLEMKVNQLDDGIELFMELADDTIVERKVHMCFGVLPENGKQRIIMKTVIGKNSKIDVLAHCTFPLAVDVTHEMTSEVVLKEGASFSYFERHVHSETGGVQVIPKTVVKVGKHAKFKTEFELLKGRVGYMGINYEAFVEEGGLVDMNARISGSEDDRIEIKEIAHLQGKDATSVLTSKVAVRDNARAEVYNKIIATAENARGHVDCKEIVKDNGIAIAIPIVDVQHPMAHVTHEAAVGSVDKKQLQTLMARGLDEDEASELIIQGMLSR